MSMGDNEKLPHIPEDPEVYMLVQGSAYAQERLEHSLSLTSG